MVIPDVNVLVNAFRDDMSAHERSAAWLEDLVNGPGSYGMANRVIEGFIRIVTHPGAFKKPAPTAVAIEFAEVLTSRENCVRVDPGKRQWEIFIDLLRKTDASGNAVPDAWLAALAIESGSEWITWDKGFARFPGLKWSLPTATA